MTNHFSMEFRLCIHLLLKVVNLEKLKMSIGAISNKFLNLFEIVKIKRKHKKRTQE